MLSGLNADRDSYLSTDDNTSSDTTTINKVLSTAKAAFTKELDESSINNNIDTTIHNVESLQTPALFVQSMTTTTFK